MFRILPLTSSIISVFILSWILTRYSGESRCINSTLVKKVTIDDSRSGLFQCDLFEQLFAPSKDIRFKNLGLRDRINRLEYISKYLDDSIKPTELHIDTKDIDKIDVSDQQITLGWNQVQKEGVLERALISIKLHNASPLSSSAIADFLWQLMNSELKEQEIPLWLGSLKSVNSYCLSDQVVLIHNEFCKVRNELSDSFVFEEDKQDLQWALRPVLAQTLVQLYIAADLHNKNKILANLFFLSEPETTFLEKLNAGNSILSFEKSYLFMLRDWLMPLGVEDKIVDSILANQGFHSKDQLTYIKIGRTSRDVFSLPVSNSLVNDGSMEKEFRIGFPKGITVFDWGSSQYFYPSDVPTKWPRREFMDNFKNIHMIYVSCDIPQLDTLMDLSSQSQKVTYIKQCNPQDVDWSNLVSMGLQSYLRKFEYTQFIEFNLNALAVAKKRNGPLPSEAHFEDWQRWLLWQGIVPDENAIGQRPLAAIDGIESFRFF